MLLNHFKIAWRNLLRNRSFSLINIIGLALGLACSLLIMLWIKSETAVDRFHNNGKYLYQVYARNHNDGKVEGAYYLQGLLADELKKSFPEIEYASGFEQPFEFNFIANQKPAKMKGTFASEDFFRMFSFPMLQGDPKSALSNPESIVISKKMAEYFYGSAEKAIGKNLEFDKRQDLLITGVYDIPSSSSLQFDYLRSWKAFIAENAWVNNWNSTSPAVFVQLKSTADLQQTENKIRDFVHRYTTKTKDVYTELALQPFGERYLYNNFKDGYPNGGRIEYVRLFRIVALFILLIACINFMNLATARSTRRAKEIGVRKVSGALRSTLIGQFVIEALLLSFLSMLIAMVMASLFLPVFNSITGKELALPFGEPVFWLSILGLLLLTGLVAGSYPALVLSAMKPMGVLKGVARIGSGSRYLRKGLVIFQFSLSVILIVGMIVIYRQIDYVQKKQLGYDRENLLFVPLDGKMLKQYGLFKDRAAAIPGIKAVTRMKEPPTMITHHIGDPNWTGKDPNLQVSFADAVVGYDFVKTLQLQLAAGRDFSTEFGRDSTSYMVNETAVKRMGYTDPVGKTVIWGNRPGTIIGVLKDFHFTSMHQAIEPMILRVDEGVKWGTALMRLEAGKEKAAIASLENLWKEMNPDYVFSYRFADQEYAAQYKSEQVISSLANYFALLAIFISCLGLFGLASFTAEQRTKEIGVRKVLGASVPSIVRLLSVNFLQPVAWSLLLSIPSAWWVMSRWLSNYAYHIELEWWIFGIAGLLTLVIALLTVSFQSIKAAIINPVRSLRSE